MNDEKKFGCIIGSITLGYIISGVAVWLWLSLSIASPWLTGLGLVAWASAIVALFGVGFIVFWVWVFLFIAATAALAMMAD